MFSDVRLCGTRVTLDDVRALSAIRWLREQLQRRFVVTAPRARNADEKYRRADNSRDFIGADKKCGVLV